MTTTGLVGLRRALTAVAAVACLGANADAQETTLFDDMPTGALLELYADVGAALRARGLLAETPTEAQAYAEHLFAVALELPEPVDGVTSDAGGVRIVVVGVREDDAGQARRGGVAVQAPASLESAGQLAVVLFTVDFQPVRGAVAPAETVGPLLDADGALRLDDSFWRAGGVEDVTARLYQATVAAAQ